MENNLNIAGRHLIMDIITKDKDVLTSLECAEQYIEKVTQITKMQLVTPVIAMKFPFNSELHQFVKDLQKEGTNSALIDKYSEYVKRKEIDDTGVSAVGIWNTSHTSTHSWSEADYISIDLFSCNTFDIEPVLEFTKKYYKADRLDCLCIERYIGKPQEVKQFTIIKED